MNSVIQDIAVDKIIKQGITPAITELSGADSNSYARSEKDSVYASETAGAAKTATAWSYNNTIYYTSGGSEPSVGDTIYSDAACTTAVTTISSIA